MINLKSKSNKVVEKTALTICSNVPEASTGSEFLKDTVMGIHWGELLLIDEMILLFSEDDRFINLEDGQTYGRSTIINSYSGLKGFEFTKISFYSVECSLNEVRDGLEEVIPELINRFEEAGV